MTYRATLSKPDPNTPSGPNISTGEHTLRNTAVRRMHETDAPVNVYDVLDQAGNRVGIAHLTLDNSAAAHEYGHLSIALAEPTCTPEKLAAIAQQMIAVAHESGVESVRIVVAEEHAPSVEGCKLIGASRAPERVTIESRPHVVYVYRRG